MLARAVKRICFATAVTAVCSFSAAGAGMAQEIGVQEINVQDIRAQIEPVSVAAGQVADLPVELAHHTTVSGRTGEVYILRGLMDVFSRGMDTLGAKLREKGFTANVANHGQWSSIARKIVANREGKKYPEPVFLIGHSLGADAVILLSERLAQNGVPVHLAVTFDPVHPRPVPNNVRKFINYYQSDNGWGREVTRVPGARTSVQNNDLKDRDDIHHTSIDKDDSLHSKVVTEMMRLSRPIRRKVSSS